MRLLLSVTLKNGISAAALPWLMAVMAVGLPAHAASTIDVSAQAEAEARAHLEAKADQAHWLEPQFELQVVDQGVIRKDEAAPVCAQPVTVEAVDTRYVSRMRFTVVCADANPWRRNMVVKARVSARVLVMAENVPAGQALRDEDMVLERRDVSATPDAMSDVEAVVGLTSNRSLREGQLLSKRVLQTPLWVTKGQSVGIVAAHAGIEVTVPGEAMDNGREGDVVRVRNTASGKVIRARVIDAGKVAPESISSVPSSSGQSREPRD